MNLRKLIFIVVTAFLFQTVNAQDEIFSGQYIIGGSFNFRTQTNTFPISTLNIGSGIGGFGGVYSSSTNPIKNTFFSFTPYAAKELNKNWLLGIQLDYRLTNYQSEFAAVFGQPELVEFERKSNQFGIGVFARYLLNPNSQFNFYLQPYAEYNILNEDETRDSNLSSEEKANYIEVGAGIGLLYNINERWRVILGIGGLNYVNGNWEIDDMEEVEENDFSAFNTNFNLASLRFGVEMKL